MSGWKPPEGWDEVFSGICLEANVLVAVLESRGLHPVVQQFSPQVWWSGSVLDDCRVYVPVDQAKEAREAIAEAREQPPDEDEPPA